jgi:hypothetical protein
MIRKRLFGIIAILIFAVLILSITVYMNEPRRILCFNERPTPEGPAAIDVDCNSPHQWELIGTSDRNRWLCWTGSGSPTLTTLPPSYNVILGCPTLGGLFYRPDLALRSAGFIVSWELARSQWTFPISIIALGIVAITALVMSALAFSTARRRVLGARSCKRCGAQLEFRDKFCPICGTRQ